jgi:hypothetical protein
MRTTYLLIIFIAFTALEMLLFHANFALQQEDKTSKIVEKVVEGSIPLVSTHNTRYSLDYDLQKDQIIPAVPPTLFLQDESPTIPAEPPSAIPFLPKKSPKKMHTMNKARERALRQALAEPIVHAQQYPTDTSPVNDSSQNYVPSDPPQTFLPTDYPQTLLPAESPQTLLPADSPLTFPPSDSQENTYPQQDSTYSNLPQEYSSPPDYATPQSDNPDASQDYPKSLRDHSRDYYPQRAWEDGKVLFFCFIAIF